MYMYAMFAAKDSGRHRQYIRHNVRIILCWSDINYNKTFCIILTITLVLYSGSNTNNIIVFLQINSSKQCFNV